MANPLLNTGAAVQTSPPEHDQNAAHTPSSEAATAHLAWLAEAAGKGEPDQHKYLLLMRFALLNLAGFGLLGVAYVDGLIDRVLVSDQTNLSATIFIVFLAGLALCTHKIWQTSRDLNLLKDLDPLKPSRARTYLAQLRGHPADSRVLLASTQRLKLSHRIGIVRNFANSLVILGLIGTVTGFIIALSGVDPKNASDINAVAPMVSTLVEGMSTALYTTLVGAVLNVWLMTNYHVLTTGTVKLITGLVELGEDHARP
ncbi:MAG: MotA/TolQ/ExbB proton channel family protein [Proteobacteria bacterium]|nr:MotA/TolQ/ExbB proton channel family protein [Pseudomonadota bacterium]MDA1325968.1 MotA/TolQ/ExbB proton channel family protein [Pseudomonadota bacterium]